MQADRFSLEPAESDKRLNAVAFQDLDHQKIANWAQAIVARQEL